MNEFIVQKHNNSITSVYISFGAVGLSTALTGNIVKWFDCVLVHSTGRWNAYDIFKLRIKIALLEHKIYASVATSLNCDILHVGTA